MAVRIRCDDLVDKLTSGISDPKQSTSPVTSIADLRYGPALVLVSLRYDFNQSAALVESFWLVISLLGLILRVRRRSPEQPSLEIKP